MRRVRALAALAVGALFGFGLAIGGMLDPAVIRGFLDLAGAFDPRLGFVFAGALVISAAGYAFSRRMLRPALAETFAIPTKERIDAPLIAGASLFGLGWGMVGLCPGPAVAALALGLPPVVVFVACMLLGMAAHDFMRRRSVAEPLSA